MTTPIADTIEREVLIHAPVERVWAVLTRAEHIGVWFGTGQPASVDLRPGGWIVFDHPGHGEIPALVEEIDAPHRLTFRWAVVGPGGTRPAQGNQTLVTLTLTEEAGGTRVNVLESGLLDVDTTQEELASRYEANAQGWTHVLAGLGRYAEATAAA
ncbi:SRPBCC domain-containing protein [Yinghuangia seranimata]|uniref:SRPBCC domain-containing protein n=1 Tax=Yinghuangia seranimata TaxID=408067 RepID=UPI00248B10E6|nr:SRPBCC domain-containing protein [Yinghuangia seranimata]MDI2125554.1 SRPBCC domain-containing protein [Yinghuangia seranimata]